jgi:hypothetical protein
VRITNANICFSVFAPVLSLRVAAPPVDVLPAL